MSFDRRDGYSLRRRVVIAWAVLRGRQTWSDGYPTPWAYEAVCEAYKRYRYGDRS